jgi:hypothetical protein
MPPLTCASANHRVGQGWVFFDWLPVQSVPVQPYIDPRRDSLVHTGGQPAGPGNLFSREGTTVVGSYTTSNPVPYEPLDQSKHCTVSIGRQN